MAISYVGSVRNMALPTHQANDLLILMVRDQSTKPVPSPPPPGGTVPVWNILEQSKTVGDGVTIMWARATASDTSTGTWTSYNGACSIALRAAASFIPVIVEPIAKNIVDPFTSTVVWPAQVATVKNGTSLGVRMAWRSTSTGYTNNAGFRPTDCGGPKITDSALSSAERMAIHTTTLNLTADIPSFTSVSDAPTSVPHKAYTFEVVEQSPITPMVMVV